MRKPLDPKAKALLTAIVSANLPSIDSIPLNLARIQVESGMARMNIPVVPVKKIVHESIDLRNERIPVRIYYPEIWDPVAPQIEIPTLIFFHGGGWVFFTLDTYDSLCTHLCSLAGAVVISVDYRRSPEYRYPVPLNDCTGATTWILEHSGRWDIFSNRFFLAGDSAGGNLAAVTAIKLRDSAKSVNTGSAESRASMVEHPISQDLYTKIFGQILIYPVTDYYTNLKPSHTQCSDGYGLSMKEMEWFWHQYLPDENLSRHPWVSPLLAEDLSGLPPALVIASGYDPLRDEGIQYARCLEKAGTKTRLTVYEDMIHGFLSYLGILKQAIPALNEIALWIREQK